MAVRFPRNTGPGAKGYRVMHPKYGDMGYLYRYKSWWRVACGLCFWDCPSDTRKFAALHLEQHHLNVHLRQATREDE